MNTNIVELAILTAIKRAVERLEGAAPAILAVDMRDFQPDEVELARKSLQQNAAQALDALGQLGYREVYLVGKTSEHVSKLWPTVPE
jgi:hypothetical protein